MFSRLVTVYSIVPWLSHVSLFHVIKYGDIMIFIISLKVTLFFIWCTEYLSQRSILDAILNYYKLTAI